MTTPDIFMVAMAFFAICITALVLKTAFADTDSKNG
jgi:hypothetical protein